MPEEAKEKVGTYRLFGCPVVQPGWLPAYRPRETAAAVGAQYRSFPVAPAARSRFASVCRARTRENPSAERYGHASNKGERPPAPRPAYPQMESGSVAA